jgi:hypothetical protein
MIFRNTCSSGSLFSVSVPLIAWCMVVLVLLFFLWLSPNNELMLVPYLVLSEKVNFLI